MNSRMNKTSIHLVRIESINDNHNDNNNGNHWRYQRSQQHQQQQQQQQNKKNTLQSSGEIIINNDDDNNNSVKIRRKRRNDEKTSQKLLIKNFPCDNNDTNTKTNTNTDDNIGNQIQSIDMKNLYKNFLNFAYCDSSNSSHNNNSNNRQNQNVNSVQIIVNNCNDSLIKNNNDNNTATIFGKPSSKSNENIKIKIPTITTPKLSIFKYFHQQQSSSSMFSSTMDSVFRLFNCNHYFYNSLNVYDQNAATTTLLLPSAIILQQSTSTYVTASSTNNNTNINSSNNNSNNKNGRIIINSTISKELSYDQNTKQVELLTINQRQSQQQKNLFSNFQSINHNNSDLLQILDNIWQITKLNQSLDLPSSLSIFTIKSIAPSHSHNNNINDNNSNLSNQNKVQQKSQNNLNNSRNSNIILKNISKHSEQQTLTNINANSSDLTSSSSSSTKSSHTSSNNRNYQYNNNNNNKQTQKHQQLQQQNQVNNNNNNNNINDIDENLSQELNKIDAQQQQQQQQQQQLSTLVVNAEECDESDDYQSSSSSSSSSTSSTSQTHQHQQYYFEFLDEEIVDDISSYNNNNNNYLAENNSEDYHPIFLHPQYRHLTLADKQRLERLFKEIDIDGNGVIDFNDLLLALEQKGIKATHENVKHLILRSDMNLDGDIDFAEFVSYCLENEKQLHVIFKDIDINSDGKIDAHELVLAFERAGIKVDEQEAVRLVRRIKADSTNSNQFELNFAEFRDYLLLHPTDSLHDLMRSWRFGTFVDLGEDGIMPVDFSETEIKTGMWWRHLLAGGVAGAVSRTSTAPLDRLKVFLQVRGAEFNGLGVCLRHMLQEGGVISLWRGNGINVLKIAPETAMKFMAFDQLKRMIHSGDPGTEITIMERFLAGSIAGAVSQTAIYPMEVLKTRFCLRQTGQYKGLFDAAQKIYSNGGIKNFYRGYIPNLIGIIPYAGIDLTIYETLKKMYTKSHSLEEAPVYVCLTCGTISSTFGQIASYPLALIRTRMQSETGHHRSSMIDMFRTIMKNEGPRGLYRGITANIMKVAPAVSISYVVYEYTRRPLGAVMT